MSKFQQQLSPVCLLPHGSLGDLWSLAHWYVNLDLKLLPFLINNIRGDSVGSHWLHICMGDSSKGSHPPIVLPIHIQVLVHVQQKFTN